MAVASLIVVLGRQAPWRHEWARTLDTLGGTTIFLGPVVAAAAALFSAQARRQRDIVDSAPRGWAAGARSAGAAAAAGLVVFIVTGAVMVLLGIAIGTGGPASAWPILTAIVSLGWYAAAGALAGTRVPSLLAVLLVGPAVFMVGAVCAAGVVPNFLRFGPSGGSLAGLAWDPSFALLQVGTMLGFVVAFLGLTAPSSVHRPRGVAVVSFGLVVALTGMVLISAHGDQRFRPSKEEASDCAGARPVVCVAASNRIVLSDVAAQSDRLAAGLVSAGAVVPSRFDQELPTSRPGGQPLFSLPSSANTEGFDAGQAAMLLSRPAACPEYFADIPPSQDVFDSFEYLEAYLLATAGENPQTDDSQLTSWIQGPLQQQRLWVKTTYAQLSSCELEAVRPPT